MLRELFVNLKKGTEYLNYGRDIIGEWAAWYFEKIMRSPGSDNQPEIRVFDLGCGHGTDLLNVRLAGEKVCDKNRKTARIILQGVENYPPYAEECRYAGIEIHSIDMEHDMIPADDASVDIMIANQVLEHTKEIFWIFSEASRVLKPGGIFITGVPNLASLHNRLLLLFGKQPTAQKSLSAHVRTFTYGDLKEFGEEGGFFRVVVSRGSNFYPFPPFISKPLSRLMPSMAWGLFVLFERSEKKDGVFLDRLFNGEVLETPFYGGPQNPQKEHLMKFPVKKSSKKLSKKKSKK